jgi:hypothetical protein
MTATDVEDKFLIPSIIESISEWRVGSPEPEREK